MGLVRCPACHRHIRRAERECPFCGTGVPPAIEEEGARPLPSGRLRRAALSLDPGIYSMGGLYGCPPVFCSGGSAGGGTGGHDVSASGAASGSDGGDNRDDASTGDAGPVDAAPTDASSDARTDH